MTTMIVVQLPNKVTSFIIIIIHTMIFYYHQNAGFTRFAEDIEMMLGRRPNMYFRVCWTVLSPAIITVSRMAVTVKWLSIYNRTLQRLPTKLGSNLFFF